MVDLDFRDFLVISAGFIKNKKLKIMDLQIIVLTRFYLKLAKNEKVHLILILKFINHYALVG
jgi:hypothetical protein